MFETHEVFCRGVQKVFCNNPWQNGSFVILKSSHEGHSVTEWKRAGQIIYIINIILFAYTASWITVIISLPVNARIILICRSRWSHGLRCGSVAARLLELRVRIPPWARMSASSECCGLSGRSPYDGSITHPEESYRVWCVCLTDCNPETSTVSQP